MSKLSGSGRKIKKLRTRLKMQIPAGQANPSPPVGSVLGQAGVNIMGFCQEFNNVTKQQSGMIVPVVINVYSDDSFDFIVKTPPAAFLIKKQLNLKKGSGEPNKDKIGTLTDEDLEEIAQIKMQDLSAHNIEDAKKIIAGTARSMGINTPYYG